LLRVKFTFVAECVACERVARRANNLVDAATTDGGTPAGVHLSVVAVGLDALTHLSSPTALVYAADTAKLAQDVRVAQRAGNVPAADQNRRIMIGIPAKLLLAGAIPGPQHIASSIVDALCMAFA
jgi:hypothetical protein